jgi:rhodanese-related sulfurtransferase
VRIFFVVLITFITLGGCSRQDTTVKSVDDYKAEATSTVVSYNTQQALDLVSDESVVFVDVRESDELTKGGAIEGAIHLPRGVLEFYIDPKSSMHMDIFSSGKKVIFYCQTGGRSVLATKLAQDMGVENPVNLEGGFRAWAEAGGSITPPTEKE